MRDIGGLPASPESTRIDRVDLNTGQTPLELLRLLSARRIQRNVAAALRSTLEVPIRLPVPRKEQVVWTDLLAEVRDLYPFRVDGRPESGALLDRTQMQQVIINLLKNAVESGSAVNNSATV